MDLSDGCVSLINAYDAYLTPRHLVLALEPVLGGNLGAYVRDRSASASHGLVMGEDEARYYFKVHPACLHSHHMLHPSFLHLHRAGCLKAPSLPKA